MDSSQVAKVGIGRIMPVRPTKWRPDGWRSQKVTQDVYYAEEKKPQLDQVLLKLRQLPGLVTSVEVKFYVCSL